MPHNFSKYYSLKHQAKVGVQSLDAKAWFNQTFTAKRLRQDINLLALESSKQEKNVELIANASIKCKKAWKQETLQVI